MASTVHEDPIDWASLECAYGSAERVPDLLRRAQAAASDDVDEWNDLWSFLCHQGTVYSASYAAVPALTAMCVSRGPRGYLPPLQLVGSILASNDAPEGASGMRDRHSAEIRRLRDLAERCLELAEDDVEFVYGLETLVAFEDRGVWSRNLSFLADGEVPLDCPHCSEHLRVHLEELSATMARQEAGEAATQVEPGAGGTPSEERLLSLAVVHGRPSVADRLRHLFGGATCPACAAEFSIAGALA